MYITKNKQISDKQFWAYTIGGTFILALLFGNPEKYEKIHAEREAAEQAEIAHKEAIEAARPKSPEEMLQAAYSKSSCAGVLVYAANHLAKYEVDLPFPPVPQPYSAVTIGGHTVFKGHDIKFQNAYGVWDKPEWTCSWDGNNIGEVKIGNGTITTIQARAIAKKFG